MSLLQRVSVIGFVVALLALVAADPAAAQPPSAGLTSSIALTAVSGAGPSMIAAVNQAAADSAGQSVTSYISVVDRSTGTVLAQTPNANTQVASESIMKLLLAAYYLVLDGGYTSTPAARLTQLSYMLRYSDDATATALFTPAAIPNVAARYGLTNTTNATDDPGHWGAARITAADLTRFLYQASTDPEVGPWLLPVMAQTAATGTGDDSDFSQAFGLNAISGTHGSKQGWGCDSYWTDPQCVVNSVGYTANAFVAILQLGDGYPDPMRATATDAAIDIARATTPMIPVGSLDSVTSPTPDSLAVTGWAADPAAAGAAVSVQVVVTGPDGRKEFDGGSTGAPRPDVAAATPWAGGAAGYSVEVQPQGAGSNQVCVSAVPVKSGTSPQAVGCQTVVVSNLIGAVDPAEVLDDQIDVSGWAANPGNPGESVQVRLTDTDSAGSVTLPGAPADEDGPVATTTSPDYGGDHGFTASAPLTQSGPQTVCVTAVSADAAAAGVAGDQQLGCQAVAVSLADEVGWLDPIQIADGTVTVAGWAQDPSASSRHLQIQLFENGATGAQQILTTVADVERPDFAAEIEADTSDHGFATTFRADPGASTVCVYAVAAVDSDGATSDALLGCQVVTGAAPNPAP